ncbi:hypothetical protein P389DRAFT_194690 [Cystobasidium minutum MCA 4210]|uniref:mitochondrial 54S ribosomal protein uL24m n=1 Tax=Cystobasidium minutum MCA 4210 TaxID=1397322 RepID=UPI0034CDB7A7|eukprot:jgi/Rhomi1/194690/gm1.2904_g
MPVKQPITLGRAAQRSFEHLIETGKKQDRRLVPRRVQHKPAWVNPKDRIPIWNIGPGDRVRVIAGEKKGKIGTVDWVDRTMNRVHLKETEFARTRPVPTVKKHAIFNDPTFVPNQKVYAPIPIHYSNVALVLERSPEQEARDEFKRSSEASSSASSSKLPEVVATRLRATNIHYSPKSRSWVWQRLAESVAEIDPVTGHKHVVEWPKQDRRSGMKPTKRYLPANPGPSDTSYEEATKATFVPPIDPTQDRPKELSIRDIEFVNVFGRAKRNERWHARKAAEKAADLS